MNPKLVGDKKKSVLTPALSKERETWLPRRSLIDRRD
jgi:hypothetical protein